MKKLLPLMLLASLSLPLPSCSKNKTCWECTFGMSNGVRRPAEIICNEGEDPSGFTDSEGNELSFFCHKQ